MILLLLLFLVEEFAKHLYFRYQLLELTTRRWKLSVHIAFPDACWLNDAESHHVKQRVCCRHMTPHHHHHQQQQPSYLSRSETAGNWPSCLISPPTTVSRIKLFLYFYFYRYFFLFLYRLITLIWKGVRTPTNCNKTKMKLFWRRF